MLRKGRLGWRVRAAGAAVATGLVWGVGTQQAMAGVPATTTTLAVSSGGVPVTSIPHGAIVTLTASVSSGGSALTVGQVNFCNAAAPHCTDINLLGTAQITRAGTAVLRLFPGVGNQSYKAEFLGTKSYAPSASSASALKVIATATYLSTTTIAATGGPGDYTLTATVTGGGGATISPGGTVSFLDLNNSNYVLGTATAAPNVYQLTFFNSSKTPIGGSSLDSIAVGDFNGDGIPDYAIPGGTGATRIVSIMLGNGDGTFQPALTTPLGGFRPSTFRVADVNDDGIEDLVLGTADGLGAGDGASSDEVMVLLGNGDGTFNALPPVATPIDPQSIAAADFNGDGKTDLVIGNFAEPEVWVLPGNGDGTFQAPIETQLSGNPAVPIALLSFVVADFNGDGKPDLAAGDFSGPPSSSVYVPPGNLTVLLGNGDGTFTQAPSVVVGYGDYDLVAGDLNGDGKVDLATANQWDKTVSVALGNGDGTFAAPTTFPLAVPYVNGSPIALGDFNGDGIPDLAVSYANIPGGPVAVLLGNGEGTFDEKDVTTGAAGFQGIATADFNGDGRTDFVEINGNTGGVYLAEATSATATITDISPVGMGVHQVDASYPGDGNFSGSVSSPIGLVAEPVPTTLTLTATPPSVLYGQTFVLSSAVSPDTGQNHNASGTVTFSIGSSTLGTVALSGGAAAWPITTLLPAGTYSYSAAYAGDTNFTPSTGTLQYVVAPLPPTIVFTVPNHTYGDAPFGVAATSNSPGAFTYSVVSGPAMVSGSTVTLTGAGTVVLAANEAAMGNYAAGTLNATFTVGKEAQTINFTQPASPVSFGTGTVALTASASSGLPVTFTVLSGPATVSGATLTATGVGSVVVAADQAGSTNYLAATEVTRTITVNQGIPVVTLAATPNPVLLRNTVTLTATVSSLSGTPTGMVMFSDGAISLGSATVVGGVASVAASALPVGADAITAAYSGDSNFLAAGSPAFNEAVEDFSLSFSGGAAQTVQYGGTATYSLAIAPIGGSSIPLAVSLAVSGVPPGSMVALTPVTLPAGSGGVNVNLSIQVPSLPARAGVGLQGRGRTLAAFALLGVVLPFRRRMRLRGSRVGWVGGFVLLLAGVSAAAGISGCGREVNPATEGFIVTVSATAGGLTHSASTPLVVQ